MVRFVFELLFGKEPATFISDYSIEESRERLSSILVRNPLKALFRHALGGKVTPDNVMLWHQHPYFSNSYAPVFFGKFVVQNDKTVLEGCFTMHWFIKAFNAYWFGMAFLMSALCLFLAVTGAGTPGPGLTLLQSRLLLLLPLAFLLAGLLFVWFCKRLGHNNKAYISERVRRALTRDPHSSDAT